MKRLAILGALAIAGCGSSTPEAAQSDSSPATIPSPAVQVMSEVPDYPGSHRVETPNFGVAGKNSRSGNNIAMETDATPTEVADFYRKWFADAGIPIRQDSLTESGGLLSAARDGQKGPMLTVSVIGGKTRIGVVRSKDGL